MLRTFFGVSLPALVLALASQAPPPHATAQEKTDAAAMRKKVTAIVARGEQLEKQKPGAPQKPGAAPLRTMFTDREANAYFKVNGPEFLPAGVVNPEVTIEQGGRVSARALVDLQKAVQPSVFNPLSWLGGTPEVTAVGTVRADNGKGTINLERATLAGVSIPKSLLQQVVSYYTRTPDSPNGFNIDEPFELPSNIRSVETARGQAAVVQP